MPFGFTGKLLEIDLSNEKVKTIELRKEIYRKFIGGRGLGAWLLWEKLGSKWFDIDPLGPENILLVLTGPLTGYYPGTRVCITGKSPQSNGMVGSTVGSEVGIELKAAGYDGIIVLGKANRPVYLMINDNNVEIRNASKMWGKGGRGTLKELMNEVMKELNKDAERKGYSKEPAVLYIGPAGEKLVRTASVMAKWVHAAGYGGYGAVMGSKNLKAIVVKGNGPLPPVKDPHKLKLLLDSIWNKLLKRQRFRMWGTGAGGWSVGAETSSEPINNWQEEWHNKENYSHVISETKLWVKRFWSDYGCPTSCMKISVVKLKNGEIAITDCPDYELMAYLGTNLGIFDVEANAYLSYLADELGLDGINTGNVMGFVAELYEKGIITKNDLGFELRWGDVEAFARLMKLIASREGFGNILAEGTYRAALKISEIKGVDTTKYAVQVKGIAVGAHGVRSKLDYPQPISYALSTQGGDHTSVAMLPLDRSGSELWTVFYDSAIICMFNGVEKDLMLEFFNAVTGWNLSQDEIINEIGPRVVNIQRAMLLIGGPDISWDPRIHDDNPPRFYEPLPKGPKKGETISRNEVIKIKKEYYEAMGWDINGVPKSETLKRLGLSDIDKALEEVRRKLIVGN
jgi:aldehyde:ferredoxin oxidoreductase